MKNLLCILLLMIGLNCPAGEREWATAGKILTGVVAADVLFNHVPRHQNHVVYVQPAPVYRPVYFQSEPRVYHIPEHYQVVQPKVWVPNVVNVQQTVPAYIDQFGKWHPAQTTFKQVDYGHWEVVQQRVWVPGQNVYENGY
jgi:hypothetical protein